MGVNLVGRVFISCGQKENEKSVAEKIKQILEKKFFLNCYLAFSVQGLNDIMKITEELKTADYYLFIDFLREVKNEKDLPISLFTHQELALAHNVGFRDIIAIQEEGTPFQGFLRYVQSNPEHFKNEEDLLKKVEDMVRERGWNRYYSRNLVAYDIQKYEPIVTYTDHSGSNLEYIWHAIIQNKRPDIAAVNAVCILDSITLPNGDITKSNDRSNLKWAGHIICYSNTILPMDFGKIDIFSIRKNRRGIFLHSDLDSPREPIVTEQGKYLLHYKFFSEGFPLLPLNIEVIYDPSILDKFANNSTHARII
jgi:hypothetical protein